MNMRELSQVYDTQFFSGMGVDKNGKGAESFT